MVKLYVDARETPTKIPESLRSLGAEIEVANLEVGDYVVDHETVVLRRTALKFVEGVLEDRIFNQATKARLDFARVVVLIEGDIFSTRVAIRTEAIDSALSQLSIVLGCSVIYHKGPHRAASILYRMAKHSQERRGSECAFRRGKVTPGLGHALFSVEGFASVGPVTSRKLLQHFGSVFNVVNASVADLCLVHGLGPTKAARLHGALRWDLHADGADLEEGASLFAEPAKANDR